MLTTTVPAQQGGYMINSFIFAKHFERLKAAIKVFGLYKAETTKYFGRKQ